MTDHAVVIAGGGPAGMMLAAELALAKVDVAIVERRPDHVLAGSRAGGFHSRTIEVLDQRGVADRFLAEGQVAQVATFGTTVLDMSDFPTRHPYALGIWQNQIERIMAAWIAELPVHIDYGCEVTGFAQDDTGVDVRLSDGESLRARYLVGCDGGRSLIRKAAGIEFPGWDPTTSNLIAEVEMAEEPELGIRRDDKGIHALGRLEYEIRDGEVVYKDGGPVRVMVTEQHVGPATEPTLRDLSDALITVYGTDFGIHNPTWISRFTDMTRQAAAYRDRRVLLAGDSAHVHYAVGGQGGFKWSLQRLDGEVLRWRGRDGGVGLIGRGGRRCVRLVALRWRGARIASGSGRRSPTGSRASRPAWLPACRPRSASGGSVTVAACRRSAGRRCRDAICRLSSARRSRS